jgi:hypothetical protein
MSAGWVREAVQITVGKERSMPSGLKHRYVGGYRHGCPVAGCTLVDMCSCVPPLCPALGHTCRYVVCEEHQKLAVLTRLLRQDLEVLGDDPLTPARAMVFTNSPEVRLSIMPYGQLTDLLWVWLSKLAPPSHTALHCVPK